jgi:hypothetical protein
VADFRYRGPVTSWVVLVDHADLQGPVPASINGQTAAFTDRDVAEACAARLWTAGAEARVVELGAIVTSERIGKAWRKAGRKADV